MGWFPAWLPPRPLATDVFGRGHATIGGGGAWDGLAEELHAAASSFGSVTSELLARWQAVASAADGECRGPYASWLTARLGFRPSWRAWQARAAAAFEEAGRRGASGGGAGHRV